MRTLILTCHTGGGHNTCAAAITEAYHSRGLTCHTADALEFASLRLSRFVSWGHTTMYRRVPALFDRGYRFAERHPGTMENDALSRLMSNGARRLQEYLREGGYDAVICVHVFAGLLLRRTLQEYPMALRTAFVATDYTCSPGAAAGELDRYFIPHESLAEEFAAQSVPREALVAGGIPISPRFAAQQARPDGQRRHLVMMCGSMGCGPIRKMAVKLAEKLEKDALVVAVCGKNQKLYEELTAEELPSLRVLGYCTEIPRYMDAADMVVTKPGGLSSTEAAVKHVPMVFINAVGGCESRNFTYFLSHGYALGSDESREVAELVVDLANCPDHMGRMRQILEKDFCVNGAVLIADRLMGLE